MNTMKAIVKKSANRDDFQLMEAPVPEVGENELLVRMKAIGVGIHDGYFMPQQINYPYTIGIEASGIVEKIGANVTRFERGDEIAFISSMQEKGGTWAEYAVVSDEALIVPIPAGMSFAQAAAIPVAGNTVLKGLDALQLEKGDSLFIAGASGAIGTFAVQLAAAKGCIVSGSASSRNHEYMQSLGAKKTVDYHDSDWVGKIRAWQPGGVDAAMAIQPKTSEESMKVLKKDGKIVSISGDQIEPQSSIEVKQFPYQLEVRDQLIDLMDKIAADEIKLFIEQAYSFENGLEALKKTQTRRARGKLVITMD